MKLFIQIPCYNEEENIAQTIKELPRKLEGVDSIMVLIIDDGSRDQTVERAIQAGAHYVRRLAHNCGLATAYSEGLDASFRLGADLVVNTDADNQYRADDIEQLIAPILAGEADLVVGDRETDKVEHFSSVKKFLQRFGTSVVRKASGISVADSTSGFRAISRRAIGLSFIHNRFSYTLESIIHAGRKGLKVANVKVNTNPMTRPSRLAKGSARYIQKNGPIILRSLAMYWPLRIFGFLGTVCLALGAALIVRFLYFYFQATENSGHIQSLQIGVGFTVIAFIIYLLAILSDLIAANRRLTEEVLTKCRNIEAHIEGSEGSISQDLDIVATGQSPWTQS
ncbi:glycosyltransferase family 2 protein [Pseudomonadota bacterium]